MTHAEHKNHRTRLISFSGIDGAGKSTQIEVLVDRLKQAGFGVALLAFWDDVAVLTRVREFSGHALFKGEKGVGAPDKPVNRQDKNVQSWYMTAVRFALYFLDAVSLFFVVAKQRRSSADVIIFDRYLHDELANLALKDRLSRIYARLLLTLTPQPDIAYLLDADPEKARERKPEYPVDFLHQNRAAYLTLSEMGGGMTVIEPLSVAEAADQIFEKALKKLSPNDLQPFTSPAQSVETAPKLG
ncbi:MAG: thymidylate kinase [Terriglobales bacterium]|jgi:thymidylate kinase